MNLCVVDLTKKTLVVGDKVEAISTSPEAKNSLYSMAEKSDTIPYEILVKLAESIRRVIAI